MARKHRRQSMTQAASPHLPQHFFFPTATRTMRIPPRLIRDVEGLLRHALLPPIRSQRLRIRARS